MPSPRCQPCEAPVRDATICAACGKQITEALDRVPFLIAELDIVLTRQARVGDRSTGRSAVIPLPYDPAASLARDRLHHVVWRWRTVVDPGTATASVTGNAAWLAIHVEQLRHLPAAADAFSDLTGATAKAERIIDLRPELWYASPCPKCGEDTYAQPGAAYVTCRCGWRADAAERRKWLLKAAEDHLAHAALIAQALSRLGQPVTGSMIRGYAFRGRLAQKGTDRLGRAMYRIGDVLDILAGG